MYVYIWVYQKLLATVILFALFVIILIIFFFCFPSSSSGTLYNILKYLQGRKGSLMFFVWATLAQRTKMTIIRIYEDSDYLKKVY